MVNRINHKFPRRSTKMTSTLAINMISRRRSAITIASLLTIMGVVILHDGRHTIGVLQEKSLLQSSASNNTKRSGPLLPPPGAYIKPKILRATKESPSHMKICQSMNGAIMNRQIFEPLVPVLIEEDPSVCRDLVKPHAAILQIFASTVLAEVANANGLGVEYIHNCQKVLNTEASKTVQMFLPAPLAMLPEGDKMNLNLINEICRVCSEDWRSGKENVDCVFWGKTEETDVSNKGRRRDLSVVGGGFTHLTEKSFRDPEKESMMDSIFPSIRENLRRAVTSWKQMSPQTEEDLDFKTRLTGMIDAQINVRDNWKTDAVIYLSCEMEGRCTGKDSDRIMEYIHLFASEIPRSITRIDIILNPSFQSKRLNELERWFREMYPMAKLQMGAEQNTVLAFLRMMEAKYLICPPGPTCLFPALSTTNFATIIDGPEWIQSSNTLVKNNMALNHPNIHIRSSSDRFQPSKCRFYRARLGKWIQNKETAPRLQYDSPLYHYASEAQQFFKPTPANPFRVSTTYVWEEDMFHQCPVQLLTIAKFCQACFELDIARIFFLGDSLAFHQSQSFWKLMSQSNNPTPLGPQNDHLTDNWTRNIQCPKPYDNKIIRVAYARNDQLIENDLPVSRPNNVQNCNAYCYGWKDRYAEYKEGKTVLIANTGPHYHDTMDFKLHFDSFLKDVEDVKKEGDVVFFRTSVPGHQNCERASEPFRSFEDYRGTITEKFDWDKFSTYNAYVDRVLHERDRMFSEHSGKAIVQLLDVYPMSILRQDGHIGSELECKECTSSKGDCLHYNLPGPLDWWNHLMFTQIWDLVVEKREKVEG